MSLATSTGLMDNCNETVPLTTSSQASSREFLLLIFVALLPELAPSVFKTPVLVFVLG